MAVPKKRTSISKKKIRKRLWRHKTAYIKKGIDLEKKKWPSKSIEKKDAFGFGCSKVREKSIEKKDAFGFGCSKVREKSIEKKDAFGFGCSKVRDEKKPISVSRPFLNIQNDRKYIVTKKKKTVRKALKIKRKMEMECFLKHKAIDYSIHLF